MLFCKNYNLYKNNEDYNSGYFVVFYLFWSSCRKWFEKVNLEKDLEKDDYDFDDDDYTSDDN